MNIITELNFTRKVKELRGILKSWQHRKLTLMGKITVVKSLALPKLIHLLTSLPNLSEKRINELNSLFFNFIWSGKPDKIKRSTLIGDIGQGGLRMIHLESFNIYLKVNWIRRFFNNPDGYWQNLLLLNLKPYGGKRLLNLQREKISEISHNITNPFWRDVFLAYSHVKPETKLVVDDILSLDILNFVPISEFKLYISWQNSGIKNLDNIFSIDSKDFFYFSEVQQKLETYNFLKYYSLVANIPKEFRVFLKQKGSHRNQNFISTTDSFVNLLVSSRKPKFVYKCCIDKIVHIPLQKFLQWEQVLNVEIVDFSKYFGIAKKSCKDSYLYNFQYKFLHRLIATNSFLYKIKMKESKLCSFCQYEEETIEHLFYDCNVSMCFWNVFIEKLKLVFKNVIFDKKCLFLGFSNEPILLNLLVFIAKRYIYKCKLNETKPNINELICKIKTYKSYEEYIARKNNTVVKFENFWTSVSQIFLD